MRRTAQTTTQTLPLGLLRPHHGPEAHLSISPIAKMPPWRSMAQPAQAQGPTMGPAAACHPQPKQDQSGLLARGDQLQGEGSHVVPQVLVPHLVLSSQSKIAPWRRGKEPEQSELLSVTSLAKSRVPFSPCMSLAERMSGQSAPAYNRFNPGWSRSPHMNIAHERDAKRKQAACMLLKCVKFLESKGLV